MSRRSRRNYSNSGGRRVTPANANRRLPTPVTSPRSMVQLDLEDLLRQVEDRRRYHPMGESSPALSTSGRKHTLRAVAPTPVPVKNVVLAKPSPFPTGVGFSAPDNVIVCIRRKKRKEVLHALGKAGKAGQKAPRRSAYSEIHC